MVHIFYPLSAARRNKATTALLSQNSVRIGQCSFTQQAGQIWGVDLEGCKKLISPKNDIEGARKAIAWAEKEHKQAA